jgi:hypothetical protein
VTIAQRMAALRQRGSLLPLSARLLLAFTAQLVMNSRCRTESVGRMVLSDDGEFTSRTLYPMARLRVVCPIRIDRFGWNGK